MNVPQTALPNASEQADRLISLGVHEIAGMSETELRAVDCGTDALLVVHPRLAPASALAAFLTRCDKRGFVVVDMPDVDQFTAIEEATPPNSRIYSVLDVDRGDSMANWSPAEALPAIIAAQRTPLTLSRRHPLAVAAARSTRTQPLLHDDRLTAAQGLREAGRAHPCRVDQQRNRPRRQCEPQCAEGGLVLGREPAHVVGICLGR